MTDIKARKTKVAELAWLLNVAESRQSLSKSSPIWGREGCMTSGQPVAYPERHPYCEFNIVLEGEGTVLVGNVEAFRLPGELLLVGPRMPHWGRIKAFPLRSVRHSSIFASRRRGSGSQEAQFPIQPTNL